MSKKIFISIIAILLTRLTFAQLTPMSIGTIEAGDSIVVYYSVKINNPVPGGTTQISNQGAISSSNIASSNTDDPKTGSFGDATITVLNAATPEVTADFRSKAGGLFSSASTWEFDQGGNNWVNASQAPGAGNNVSIIHSITLDQNFIIASGKTLALGTGGTLTVNPTRTLTVTGIADFGGKLVTFRSTAAGVGSLGQVASPVATHLQNATNVTVERFIPNTFRKWELLSVPTFGSQTIKASWQEGNAPLGNNKPGYGIQIPGPGGTANGFDAATSGNAGSLLRWNSGAWANVPGTLGAISADPYKAYFVFVRGDRTKGVAGTNSNTSATTLETNGTVYAGDQISQSVPANSFGLVGNLYPSAINFTTLTRNNVEDVFYIWDSKLANGTGTGQYQTFSGTNYYTSLTGGSYGTANVSSNTTIESGQAFLVRTGASPGTITMHENSKISLTNGNLGFRPATPAALVKMDTRLHRLTGNGDIADGNAVVFDNAYAAEVDGHDALKLNNTAENFAILTNNMSLAVEGRPAITDKDVIAFKMWNMKQQDYQLEFIPSNLNLDGMEATLEDAYLRTTDPVSLEANTTVRFTVDANAASAAADRFKVVFRKTTRGETGEVKAAFAISPNPAEAGIVNLQFINQAEGKYSVRLVNDAGQTVYTTKVSHTGTNSTQVLNLPKAITRGIYSVEIISKDKIRSTKTLFVNKK